MGEHALDTPIKAFLLSPLREIKFLEMCLARSENEEAVDILLSMIKQKKEEAKMLSEDFNGLVVDRPIGQISE